MSNNLYDWLNSYVKLSSKITSIESDFSNGYYFAELLSKFQQIPNPSNYSNQNDNHTITKNYIYLTKALSDLHIHLPNTRQHEIINKKTGVASQLIYKIKQELSKKLINFDTLKAKQSKEIGTIYHQLQFNNDNEKYYRDYRNRKSHPKGGKGRMRLDPIDKLYATADDFTKGVAKAKREDDEYLEKEHDEQKKKIMDADILKGKTMREGDTKLLNQWKNRMKIKKDFDQKCHDEEWKDALQFIHDTLKSFEESTLVEIEMIKRFDETLARLGLDLNQIDNGRVLLNEKTKFVSTEIIMSRIREKVALEEKSRKDKIKRARRLLNEQKRVLIEQTTQNNIEAEHKRSELISQSVINRENEIKEFELQKKVKFNEYEKCIKMHTKENFFHTAREPSISININEPYVSITDVFNPKYFFGELDKETISNRINQSNIKQEKRSKYTDSIKHIVDMMIDVTDRASDYQQTNHVDLIQIPEWANWIQMLIEDQPLLANEKLITEHSVKNDIIITHPPLTEDMVTYSSEELFDYINYIGQWKPKPLPLQARKSINKKKTQLSLYDVLGNDISYLLAAGKFSLQGIQLAALKTMTNEAFEPRKEDEENIEVALSNCLNPALGEIIEFNLDIKYSSLEQIVEAPGESITELFDYIPIKLCFLGHLFSGRKAIGNKICEMFPKMKAYSVEELLKKTIEAFDHLSIPIENHPKYKTMKKNQIEQLQKEKAAEEEKFAKTQAIINPYINQSDGKLNKEDIPDSAIIDLLFEKIKEDFPLRSKEEINDDIDKRNKRKGEITAELEKMKEDTSKKAKPNPKVEQALNNEYNQLINDSYVGFIIVDYPRSYEQLVLFEKKTKGNMQEIDKEESEKSKRLTELTKIIDKPYHTPSSKSKLNSFFDGYYWFEVSEDEVIRRHSGSRVDPNTGNKYHIEDNPPPENDKKLNERLETLKNPTQANILDDKKIFNLTSKKVTAFIDLFSNLSKITLDKRNVSEIAVDMKENLLSKIIKKYEQKDNDYSQQHIYHHYATTNTVNNNFSPEASRLSYHKRITDCKKRIPSDIAQFLILDWTSFNESYNYNLHNVFSEIKDQRKVIIDEMSTIQDSFIQYLNTESDKKELVDIFCNKYATFMQNYLHLQKSFIVKVEFHKDLQILNDRLWAIINQRKALAITERERIMSTGFIEAQMNTFYNNIEELFLNEAEKYLRSICLIKNFYFSMDQSRITIGEKCPFTLTVLPNQILKDITSFNLIEINPKTKGLQSPKINKIYLNCYKLLFEFDYSLRELEKSIKAANLMNSSDISGISYKKRIKTGPSGKELKHYESAHINIEPDKEPFSIDEEIKTAIKNEKEKYKYRLGLIKSYGLDSLGHLKRIANETYSILDEWIIDSVHLQNNAMNTLVSHLRNQIGKESMLRWYYELDKFNFYNPITPKFELEEVSQPIPINSQVPLINEKDKERLNQVYNINEFSKLIQTVKTYEIQAGYITEDDFILIFLKKCLVEEKSKGLSKQFKELSYHHYIRLIRKFVFGNRRVIKVNNLLAVIALIHYDIIDYDDLKTLKEETQEHLINNSLLRKEMFMELELWIENSDSEEKSNDGTSDQMTLKEILYELFKDPNEEMIDFNAFIDAITLANLNKDNCKEDRSYKKYFELLEYD